MAKKQKTTKTATATVAKTTKAPKGKAKEAKVDAYGFRVGSNKAKMMAMLSKDKPVTMGEIVEAIGCKSMYNVINPLVKKHLVWKGKDGYVLVK